MSERRDPPLGRSRAPRSADEQDAAAPERPVTPQEEAGQDVASLDDPPQAEGERGRAEADPQRD